MTGIKCVSRAAALPFEVTDAARSAEAVKKAAEAGEVLATVGQVRCCGLSGLSSCLPAWVTCAGRPKAAARRLPSFAEAFGRWAAVLLTAPQIS